jgi:hypothetical protein
VIVTSTSVQLKVVAASVAAVPEPATAALAATVVLLPAIRRRYNRS